MEYGQRPTSGICGFEKIWNEGTNRPSGCFESTNTCTLYNYAENGGNWHNVRVVCKSLLQHSVENIARSTNVPDATINPGSGILRFQFLA